MDLSERLVQAMKFGGFETQEELAEAVRKLPGGKKFEQQTFSSMATGRTKNTGYIVHIAVACQVRAEWLQFETGPMKDGASTGAGALSPKSLEIARAYHLASEKWKEKIAKLAMEAMDAREAETKKIKEAIHGEHTVEPASDSC